MEEVCRRIERVDMPDMALVGSLDPAALLHDEPIPGASLREFLEQGFFGAMIRQADEIARPLHRHLQLTDFAEIALEAATRLDRGGGHYGHKSGADHGIPWGKFGTDRERPRS